MKYPDHEFEEHLRKARIVMHGGVEYLFIAGNYLPVSMCNPNKLSLPYFNYTVHLFWMESFDNAQREAVQKKLVALRVQKRLGGK